MALTKKQKEMLKKFGCNLSGDISDYIRDEIAGNFEEMMIDAKIEDRDDDSEAYDIIYQSIKKAL